MTAGPVKTVFITGRPEDVDPIGREVRTTIDRRYGNTGAGRPTLGSMSGAPFAVTPMPATVWVANRVNEVDGLYVFTDRDDAETFAAEFSECVVTEEPIFEAGEQAAGMIETAREETAR